MPEAQRVPELQGFRSRDPEGVTDSCRSLRIWTAASFTHLSASVLTCFSRTVFPGDSMLPRNFGLDDESQLHTMFCIIETSLFYHLLTVTGYLLMILLK